MIRFFNYCLALRLFFMPLILEMGRAQEVQSCDRVQPNAFANDVAEIMVALRIPRSIPLIYVGWRPATSANPSWVSFNFKRRRRILPPKLLRTGLSSAINGLGDYLKTKSIDYKSSSVVCSLPDFFISGLLTSSHDWYILQTKKIRGYVQDTGQGEWEDRGTASQIDAGWGDKGLEEAFADPKTRYARPGAASREVRGFSKGGVKTF